MFELVPRSRRAAYVAFHNVGTAAGVFGGAMLGAAAVTVLPERTPFFGAAAASSNLLYLFGFSGLARAIIAGLLARSVRDLRTPRKELTAQALVLRVTGFNAMLGLLYDFIGRNPSGPMNEDELDSLKTMRGDPRDDNRRDR